MKEEQHPIPDDIKVTNNNDAMFLTSAISADSDRNNNKSVVNSEVITTGRGNDPLVSGRGKTSIGLRDLKKVMAKSTRFQEVSLEQIERVRKMHENISEGSKFSFNYNTLLCVASILAGLGLVSNASTTIIASMLVSPIMGPVVGMAYGATIQDWRLFRMAFKTEMLSLLICVLMGLMLGLCTGWTDLGDDWPTVEMYTRATWQNFLVALPVAFFSGLGVAVSLLDEQTSSLVGVAISASLLPPAVNAGILWVAYGFFEKNRLGMVELVQNEEDIYKLLNVDQTDFRKGGFISLGLTVANVILIIVASMLMFRFKEKLPIKKKIFWEDLGVARKIYSGLALMAQEEEEGMDQINEELGETRSEEEKKEEEEEAETEA